MARERGTDWESYCRNLWQYRNNRATEIWDRTRDAYDDLFTYDWWHRHHGRAFLLGGYSPWWWWIPCPWDTLIPFSNFGWDTPLYYDYDANVIIDDDYYVDGQDFGPRVSYTQHALQLANPPVAIAEPVPPQEVNVPSEWQPLGVFALTQQEQGDAVMFFQLAINKEGLISGAFANTLTDESAAVAGSVDKGSQRAASHRALARRMEHPDPSGGRGCPGRGDFRPLARAGGGCALRARTAAELGRDRQALRMDHGSRLRG